MSNSDVSKPQSKSPSILRTSNRRTIQTNIQRTSLKSRSTIKSNEYPSKRAFNENASNFYQLYNTNKSKIQRRSNEHLSKIQRTLTEHVSKALYRSSSEDQSKPDRTYNIHNLFEIPRTNLQRTSKEHIEYLSNI